MIFCTKFYFIIAFEEKVNAGVLIPLVFKLQPLDNDTLFPEEFIFNASTKNMTLNLHFVQLQGYTNDFSHSNIYIEDSDGITKKNFTSNVPIFIILIHFYQF